MKPALILIATLAVCTLPLDARPQVIEEPQIGWAVRYDGPDHFSDRAAAIAVDAAGNTYVTGTSFSLASWDDILTVKYSPEGALLWTQRYNGADNLFDKAVASAVDHHGNIYVVGSSQGTTSDRDYAIIKYSPDGNLLWHHQFDGPNSGRDEPVAVAVDPAGHLYVTGACQVNGTDILTVKYSPEGALLWTALSGDPSGGVDRPAAIAVDAAGNAYVTGECQTTSSTSDLVTMKYSPSGQILWRRVSNVKYRNAGRAIVVDDAGQAHVAGGRLVNHSTLLLGSRILRHQVRC